MNTIEWLFKKRPLGAAGLLIIVFWVLVAIAANRVAPYDPAVQKWRPLQPPSTQHLMGTDRLGRDLLSRVIFGSRISMVVGLSTVAISFVVGLLVALPSTFAGGIAENVVQRIVDTLLSFPGLLLALLLANLLGQGLIGVIIAIAFVRTVHGIRGGRGLVLQEMGAEYVMAARVIGCTSSRICFRHILPNIMPLVIIGSAGGIGDSILAEAGLSFLGLGVPPPTPSWGSALSPNESSFFSLAPWIAIFPGLALSSAVLAFNIFGDALRDAVDPWLRHGRGL